jgi:hypothetical protein
VAALGGLIIYLSKNPPIEILIQKFEVICTKPSQIVIRVAEKCNLFVALLQSNYFWINLGCFMPVGFLIQFGKKNKYFFSCRNNGERKKRSTPAEKRILICFRKLHLWKSHRDEFFGKWSGPKFR